MGLQSPRCPLPFTCDVAKVSCHVGEATARARFGFGLLTWQNLIDVLFHLNVRLLLIQGGVVGCCVHRVRTVHVIVGIIFILTWDSEGAQVWQEGAKAW